MAAPSVYLDECVDHDLVEALRKRGFVVTSAADEDQADKEIEDDAQLAYATTRGWLTITHNEGHFWALHRAYQQQGQEHGGIVILPQNTPFERLEIRAAMMLDWLATLPDVRSRFFNWGQLQQLLEQGYLLPGYDKDEVRLALGRQSDG